MSITPPRHQVVIAGRESVYVDASRAAEWGLGVNIVLMIVKMAGGVVTASSALIADAVNSIGDVASAMAVRGALHVAQIEEDEDHPYGHTKAESIAGLCVALLVAFSAALLAVETMKRFDEYLKVPTIAAGLIARICGVSKEVIYQYTRRVAKRLDSSALRATAWDHRADAMSSGMVAVSLLLAPYAGWVGPYIDPIAAMCVCTLLVITGLRIFIRTARELMDQQADEATVAQIRNVSAKVDGVKEVEKLRVSKKRTRIFHRDPR